MDFEWNDTLDNGREVLIHAIDYERADDSVGLGESCWIYATDGEEKREGNLIVNEVLLTDGEKYRFQNIGLEMFHDSWSPEYPD